MRGLKILLVALAGILFQLGVVAVVLSVIFLQILATPEPLKSSIQEAGVYEAVVEDIRSQLDGQLAQNLNNDGAIVQQATEQAFSQELLRTEVEQAIDTSYEWLRGETDTLSFTLDFTDARVAFAETLGDNTRAQLADVPTCTSPAQFQPDAEIWELTCIPPGVNRDELVDDFVAESLASDDFLSNLSYSSDDVLAGVDFDTEKIPKNFQRLEQSLLPAVALVIASGLAIVGFSVNKKKGIRRAGAQFVFAGGGLLLPAGALWLFMQPELLMAGAFENATQEAVLSALTILIRDALVISMIAGAILLLVGLLLRFIFKKPKK